MMFRMDSTSKDANPSKAQMEVYMGQWTKWINYISEKGQLAEGGNHFGPQGKVVRPHHIQEGFYEVNHEYVAGYIIVMGKDMLEAVALARECPILNGEGTSIEIREIVPPGNV